MQKLWDMVVQLIEVGIDVTIRKDNERICAYFQNGFYRSDGDAYIFLHKGNVILHTRFDGEHLIQSMWDLGYTSHATWKLCKGLNPKWHNHALPWVWMYKKLRLEQ